MLVKNILLIVCSVMAAAMIVVIIMTGWVGRNTFFIQLILLSIFTGLMIWDLWDRPAHDPVRKFFVKTWNKFWSKC